MADRAVFILAAGDGSRWIGDGVGVWPHNQPKQLLPIGGTTIIGRTVNMVRWYGYWPIVVTHNPAIVDALPGVEILKPTARRWLAETLQSTRPHWQEINTVLWSDVIYSDAVINAMLTDESSIKFYGKWGDGYGLVWRKDNPCIEDGLAAVIQDAEQSGLDKVSVGRSWELYRWFMGWDLREHVGPTESNDCYERVPDDDYSRDVDKPSDWEAVQRDILDRLTI